MKTNFINFVFVKYCSASNRQLRVNDSGSSCAQQVSATGKVYNLNRLSDFPGTYHGVARGPTLIEGKMHVKLTNQNGVTMYLAGETEGLASSLGAQAFEVNLTN
jgi:hypothetical protein